MKTNDSHLPKVITVEALQEFCSRSLIEIRLWDETPFSQIEIRYVIDTNKFGYAYFGEFFFHQGNLYVFEEDEQYKDQHDAEAVMATFGDECENLGFAHKVIFAGVKTPYKDMKGDAIYTGDAVMVDRLGLSKDHIHGVRPLDFLNDYGCMLDMHSVLLSECKKIVRVGTVFFNLPKIEEEDMLHILEDRSRSMYNWYGGGPTGEENLLHVRFTPNFFDKEWHYHGMEILRGEDFDWRK